MAPYVHYISFSLLVLAGFNLPISEDLVIIVSASIAATVVPEHTVYIFLACFLGAYISDITSYYIGKFAVPKLLDMKFLQNFIPEKRILMLEVFFNKYGGKTLFFGRFIPFGFRNAIFMTAGLVKMSIGRFLLIDMSSLSITLTILFLLGYKFGKNYTIILDYISQYKTYLFIVLSVFAAILIIRKFLSRNK
jgi:membrane protein DedA with SNARE-associated domain